MAKPILVLNMPYEDRVTREVIEEIIESIKRETNNDYHVLAISSCQNTNTTFECLNDCKGLPDVDIEELIDKYIKLK